ncbi:hypothetical protein Poly51_52180 [Rubripirellula tenax]|uniref:Uncharacterized protein n=1 Tax=Rubripirellula tenax TaxID=2528015 RepID=A0A5C6EEZ9_9BACT|nr:hypothetical protein [Rubripirellula tenax]TWU47418.1 hypothetical protein Poly51_52180 [Rubripirellula tenax]
MKLTALRSRSKPYKGQRHRLETTMSRWAFVFVCLCFTNIVSAPTASAQVNIGAAPQSPQTNLVPVGPPPASYPPSTYGSFDPYANTPSASSGIGPPVGLSTPPSAYPSTAYPGTSFPATTQQPFRPFGGLFSQPASVPSNPQFNAPPGVYGSPSVAPSYGDSFAAPSYGPPSYQYDNSNVYGPPASFNSPTASGFPSTIYPSSSPTTLFPEGMFSGPIFPGMDSGGYSAYQLLRGPRFRNGYVGFGDSDDDLNMNDTDVSIVFAFPNFFYSNQPIFVVPSFSMHLWDGPKTTANKNADLPGSAYSAFLDVGWNSDPNQMISTELGVRIGAFTDFDTFNSDSIRILGKALASFRLTPTSTLKGGIYYLDRNELKIVPAFGVLCQPNPYTRVDLFFPQPKFARYFRTLGTQDFWWYLSGDYGGGSWTVTRASGGEDSIDINDIRAVLGLEWGRSDEIRSGKRIGFAEIGYVFERELRYRRNPNDNLNLDDGIMFRVGLGY